MWHWRKKWCVGFEQHIFWWTPQRSLSNIVCSLKRNDSRKRYIRTAFYTLAGFVLSAGKAVKDRTLGHSNSVKNIKCVWPCVACVND